MFLVASGTAEITTGSPDVRKMVARMGPGESLGAIGLVTGAPYAATATAPTPLTGYRTDRAGLSAAIRARPEPAVALEELARRGQEAIRRDAAAPDQAEQVHPEMFLSRLRGLLRTLGS